jgi:hypothetical protein
MPTAEKKYAENIKTPQTFVAGRGDISCESVLPLLLEGGRRLIWSDSLSLQKVATAPQIPAPSAMRR